MWRSAGRIAAVVALAAGGLWYATFGSFEQEIRLSVDGGYPLPDFSLPSLSPALFEGDTTYIGREDLKGQVAILTFWATWCTPCIAEQPSLMALQEEFGDQGFILLGVLHRDEPRKAMEWLRVNNRLDFQTIVGTRDFAIAAGVGGLPNTILVDRDGTVTELFLGYRPERDSYVREAVRDLLKGGAP